MYASSVTRHGHKGECLPLCLLPISDVRSFNSIDRLAIESVQALIELTVCRPHVERQSRRRSKCFCLCTSTLLDQFQTAHMESNMMTAILQLNRRMSQLSCDLCINSLLLEYCRCNEKLWT